MSLNTLYVGGSHHPSKAIIKDLVILVNREFLQSQDNMLKVLQD